MRSLQLSVVVASFLFALPLLIVTGQHGFETAAPQGKSPPLVASPSAQDLSSRALPVVPAAAPAQ